MVWLTACFLHEALSYKMDIRLINTRIEMLVKIIINAMASSKYKFTCIQMTLNVSGLQKLQIKDLS